MLSAPLTVLYDRLWLTLSMAPCRSMDGKLAELLARRMANNDMHVDLGRASAPCYMIHVCHWHIYAVKQHALRTCVDCGCVYYLADNDHAGASWCTAHGWCT